MLYRMNQNAADVTKDVYQAHIKEYKQLMVAFNICNKASFQLTNRDLKEHEFNFTLDNTYNGHLQELKQLYGRLARHVCTVVRFNLNNNNNNNDDNYDDNNNNNDDDDAAAAGGNARDDDNDNANTVSSRRRAAKRNRTT
jgi:deoxyadenosine/deoxycytidine kinase